MAITNPNLLDGFDVNNTSLQSPSQSLIDNGYAFGDTLQSSNINYYLNEIYKNLNYLKTSGFYQYDASQSYDAGARISYLGEVYLSKTDNNSGNTPTVKGEDTYWKWENFGLLDTTTDQTIGGIKTFSSNPLSTATQSTNANALTKYSEVVKNTGNEAIAGIKTFSSFPITPSLSPTLDYQTANKKYVDNNSEKYLNFGIGGNSVSKGGVTPIDDLSENGLYYYSSGTGVSSGNGHILHQQVNSSYAYQIAIIGTGTFVGDMYKRSKDAGVWGDWVLILDSKNGGLGVVQTWQNVTASRSAGVTYTNTTGKPIFISIEVNIVASSMIRILTVDGIAIRQTNNSVSGQEAGVGFFVIIPNGSTYSINSSFTVWNELR